MRSIRCPAAVLLATALILAAVLPASGEDGIVRLSVVFTNDIHGGIDRTGATFMNREFPPPLGGAASAATYIGALRARAAEEGGYVLVIDQGDIFQGTPVGNYNDGEAVIEYFNRLGVDLWTVGNHDFDEGYENLWHLIEYSEMPVLSANLVWAETQEPVEYVEPYIIKDYGGIKVAIIGLTTTDTPEMAFPAHVEPVAFLDEIETAKKYVREAREKGADIVLVSGHMGLPYDPVAGYAEMMDEEEEREGESIREPLEERKWGPSAMEISHYAPGIDAFFGGHIHKGFDKPWEEPTNHTLHFQTYGRGSGVGHVDLLIDTKTKTLAGYELPDYRGALITLFEDEWWPETEMAAMIEARVEEAEKGMDRVIGQSDVDLTRGGDGETRMGNLVCDAMREEVSADFAFTNLGGIRDEIPAGPVTPQAGLPRSSVRQQSDGLRDGREAPEGGHRIPCQRRAPRRVHVGRQDRLQQDPPRLRPRHVLRGRRRAVGSGQDLQGGDVRLPCDRQRRPLHAAAGPGGQEDEDVHHLHGRRGALHRAPLTHREHHGRALGPRRHLGTGPGARCGDEGHGAAVGARD